MRRKIDSAAAWAGPLTALLLAAASAAQAARYAVEPASSSVKFRVRHLLVNRVHGEFKRFSGEFEHEPGRPASWTAKVSIEAASIDTGIAKRDKHLRSEDFLFVSSHPAITFVSSKAEPREDGRFTLSGTVTIRGVERPATLEVEPMPTEGRAPRFRATAVVDRFAFGVGHNESYKTGSAAIGKEVRITIEVEGRPVP